MNDKLIVRNFGPIKECEIELKRVNILIGEQGTGKSTIAKLIAIFKDFDFYVNKSQDIFNNYGFGGYFKDDTFIQYTTRQQRITFEPKKSFTIEQSGDTAEWIDTYIKTSYNQKLSPDDFSETIKLRQRIISLNGEAIYIPAERAFAATIANAALELEISIVEYLKQFLRGFLLAPLRNSKTINFPHLQLTFKRTETVDYVNYKGIETKLSAASSGVQSITPLLVIIDILSKNNLQSIFLIEEPELNLFPSTQNELIKHLIRITSSNKDSLFITTHSPYVLTTINNLLYAYHVGQSKQETEKIIDKELWLNIHDVNAFLLKNDGTFENIIDYELPMIKAELIDEISNSINAEYGRLVDLEYGNVE